MAMKALVEQARKGGGPALLVVNTYRMMGHSSSDDPSKYRDAKEVEKWQKRDPIDRYNQYLVKQGIIKTDELASIEAQIYQEIDNEIHIQEAAPAMPLKSLVEDIYAEMPRHLMKQYNDFIRIVERYGEAQQGDGAFPL
jgi:TPP-dependent pyruvate/acetoin dehydrogenase alpha subunit